MRRLLLATAFLTACGGATGAERVAIPPGSTLRAVSDSLAAHHLIRFAPWFRLRARLQGSDRQLKAGVYEFTRGTATGTLLRALRNGDALHFDLTLPGGGTLFDLARNAERVLAIPADSLLRAAADSTLRARYHIPGPTVEGWLRPETFAFNGFATASEVLQRFLDARATAWDSTWDARAAAARLTRAQLLTLASIVEAEAKLAEDRPLIAAVYRNRLQRGMALQADPTIEYAYLLRDGERKPRLYEKDYALASPWNTYLHPGLPPGPIGNPTREAIEAVLSPADVPYLYFVAGPDGKHRFSRTYAEHLANVRRVRKGR